MRRPRSAAGRRGAPGTAFCQRKFSCTSSCAPVSAQAPRSHGARIRQRLRRRASWQITSRGIAAPPVVTSARCEATVVATSTKSGRSGREHGAVDVVIGARAERAGEVLPPWPGRGRRRRRSRRPPRPTSRACGLRAKKPQPTRTPRRLMSASPSAPGLQKRSSVHRVLSGICHHTSAGRDTPGARRRSEPENFHSGRRLPRR